MTIGLAWLDDDILSEVGMVHSIREELSLQTHPIVLDVRPVPFIY